MPKPYLRKAMHPSIYYNNEPILTLSNSLLSIFHGTIMEIIEKENIWFSYRLQFMLSLLDQQVYGPGGSCADIEEYLKTKKEMLLFAYLVKETIKEKKEIFSQFGTSLQHLEEFHDKLVNYAENLPE